MIRKLILLMLGCSLFLEAQQQLTWLALTDVSGTGAAVALSATTQVVRFCQFVAPAANASTVRWGDSTISATKGALIAAGSGQFIPSGGSGSPPGGVYLFDLAQTFVFVANGDKLSITCAK